MFTQCDGRIFIGALSGTTVGVGGGPAPSWVTLLEVVQAHSGSQEIDLVQRDRLFVTGDNGAGNQDLTMGLAGTVHVAASGALVGNATEKDFDLGELPVGGLLECDEDPACP